MVTLRPQGHTRSVVWQTPEGSYSSFEFEYIDKVLLAGVPHDNIFDAGRYAHDTPGCTLIVNNDRSQTPRDLLTYIERTAPDLLIHLSGEHLRSPGLLYKTPPIVLRSYYDPRIVKRNVFAIPLGFKSGHLRQTVSPAVEARDLVWSFAGQLRGDRASMLECLAHLEPNHAHTTSGWNTRDSLSPQELTGLLRRSIFGPCPFGLVNPDSFRIMECLEAGAIPVCLRFRGVDYFRYIYGDHPFILATDWSDAARQMSKLLGEPRALSAKLDAVAAWYASFKQKLAADIAAIFEGSFDGLKSEQFEYQEAGRRSPRLRLVFDLHFGTDPRFRKLRMRLARWGLWRPWL